MIEKSPDKSSMVHTTMASFAANAGVKSAPIASNENVTRDDTTLRRIRTFMRGRLSLLGPKLKRARATLFGGSAFANDALFMGGPRMKKLLIVSSTIAMAMVPSLAFAHPGPAHI